MTKTTRRILIGGAVVLGGLGLAGRALFSYEVDAQGAKGLIKEVLAKVGSEAGIPDELTGRVGTFSEGVVDRAVPRLKEVYQGLEKVEAGGAGSAAALEELHKSLVALIDFKDQTVKDARDAFSSRERAGALAKLGAHFRERSGLEPDGVESLIEAFRHVRQGRIASHLELSPTQKQEFVSRMDVFATERKALRGDRRAAFEAVEAAVTAGNDPAIEAAMKQWDQLGAKASDITRRQLEEGRKLFSAEQRASLAKKAKERIDRAMWIASLVIRFQPLKG